MKMGIFTAAAFLAFGTLGSALAEEGEQACMSYAFAICGQFIPDHDQVATCLYSNVTRVSAPCRQVLARHDRTRTMPARMTMTH